MAADRPAHESVAIFVQGMARDRSPEAGKRSQTRADCYCTWWVEIEGLGVEVADAGVVEEVGWDEGEGEEVLGDGRE
jgi:hypothetical protein